MLFPLIAFVTYSSDVSFLQRCPEMYKTILFILGISGVLYACSAEQAYNAMAQNQCQRDAEHNPAGNTVECINENRVDGRSYSEYERARKGN